MKQLLIIGASGHGKVVADIARLNGYDSILFFDDDEKRRECGTYPIVGRSSDIDDFEGDVFIAIGNAEIREKIHKSLTRRKFPTLIHPAAVVADTAYIGEGTVIMAGAVVNADAAVGEGCIINTCASVDHDCVLGKYVHVSVGVHVSGTVNIGDRTWIGAGATVSNNLNLCSDCLIYAGAVVVKNIEESGAYLGVPAKKIK